MSTGAEEFNPSDQYAGKGPDRRQRFVRWFHNNRLRDFADLIESGDRLLSVGSGNAELESKILGDRFETIYTLEIERDRAERSRERGLESIHGSAPPLPFQEGSLDAIVAAGTVEHLPDERGFFEEAHRCLSVDGALYVTIPIEVGIGGWGRYLAKNFVHPDRHDSPDGVTRYFDYSLDEFQKRTPRDKHGTAHRYYNYTYAVSDLREIFDGVSVRGWPIGPLKQFNLLLFAEARE